MEKTVGVPINKFQCVSATKLLVRYQLGADCFFPRCFSEAKSWQGVGQVVLNRVCYPLTGLSDRGFYNDFGGLLSRKSDLNRNVEVDRYTHTNL